MHNGVHHINNNHWNAQLLGFTVKMLFKTCSQTEYSNKIYGYPGRKIKMLFMNIISTGFSLYLGQQQNINITYRKQYYQLWLMPPSNVNASYMIGNFHKHEFLDSWLWLGCFFGPKYLVDMHDSNQGKTLTFYWQSKIALTHKKASFKT